MSTNKTPQELFWPKVNKTETCWLWTANRDRDGYGLVKIHGVSRRAHRVSYEWARGPIPAGRQIDHLCRTPACVNPDHLEAVTPRVNVMRSDNLCARNARKTHCNQGHPLAGDNLYTVKSGARRCAECARVEARKRYWQKRGEVA